MGSHMDARAVKLFGTIEHKDHIQKLAEEEFKKKCEAQHPAKRE